MCLLILYFFGNTYSLCHMGDEISLYHSMRWYTYCSILRTDFLIVDICHSLWQQREQRLDLCPPKLHLSQTLEICIGKPILETMEPGNRVETLFGSVTTQPELHLTQTLCVKWGMRFIFLIKIIISQLCAYWYCTFLVWSWLNEYHKHGLSVSHGRWDFTVVWDDIHTVCSILRTDFLIVDICHSMWQQREHIFPYKNGDSPLPLQYFFLLIYHTNVSIIIIIS